MPDEPTIPPPQDWMLPISEGDPGLAGLSIAPEPAKESGPPRCACGYLLEGLVDRDGLVRCPECGKEQRADGSDRPERPDVGYMVALLVLPAVFGLFGTCAAGILTVYAFGVQASGGEATLFGLLVTLLLAMYPITLAHLMKQRATLRHARRGSLIRLWVWVAFLTLVFHGVMLLTGAWLIEVVIVAITLVGLGGARWTDPAQGMSLSEDAVRAMRDRSPRDRY